MPMSGRRYLEELKIEAPKYYLDLTLYIQTLCSPMITITSCIYIPVGSIIPALYADDARYNG